MARSKSGRNLRRTARRLALQLVYAYDQKHYEDDGFLLPAAEPDDAHPQIREFARELFDGLCRERQAVDAAVDERLTNWTLGRMAVPDRSLLRLGAYEMIYCAETPLRVVITEYVELAKGFGSDGRTAKLINGVLDRIGRDFRKDEARK
jgi:transcription antitermination protein NusB